MDNVLINYFKKLVNLQKAIFLIYVNRDYFEKVMDYEKKIIHYSSAVMRAMQKIRVKIKDKKYIAQLENIYELIFSLNLLKNRLIDHSTFEICEQELKNVSACLAKVMLDLALKKPLADRNDLDVAIESLEFIFQNTLQVVTADPMVFLFFIRNLHALNDELRKLTAHL